MMSASCGLGLCLALACLACLPQSRQVTAIQAPLEHPGHIVSDTQAHSLLLQAISSQALLVAAIILSTVLEKLKSH